MRLFVWAAPFLALLLAAALAPSALAHGPEAIGVEQAAIEAGVWTALGLSAVVIAVAVLLALFALPRLSARAQRAAKPLLYAVLFIAAVGGTLYAGGVTVWLNQQSPFGGPVHWHADFEVWACGEQWELADPTGLENRIGSAAIHEHGDNRIHIEGVLLSAEEAELSAFFEKVGGELTESSFRMPTTDGMRELENGALCDGRPGQWTVFVNGELEPEHGEHVLAPHTTVPPGDRIKLVFDSRPASELDPDLGGEP